MPQIRSGGGKDVYYQHALRNNGAAVFEYSFLINLPEKSYVELLKKAYFYKTGQKLNLRNPKNINEKIQWLKVYDNKPIKTLLTDKILVRDWVSDKIGEKYLKPIFQVCSTFDEIDFNSLPDSFVVKCNHGCKWNYIVKNKTNYLSNNKLFIFTRERINGWLSQNFFGWSDFETQYKNINPKVFVEKLMRENVEETQPEIEVWCFNSKPLIVQKTKITVNEQKIVSTYDENLNNIDLKFIQTQIIQNEDADEFVKKAVELSKELSTDFKFVRIDWTVYKNQLYFMEMTFTPFSGFFIFEEKYKNWYLKLGKMLNLKGN